MPTVAVALKWVDRRPDVDPLTGRVSRDPRTSGASDADRAALEWGLRLAERWGWETLAVTAGRAESEAVLVEAVAVGAGRAVRVDLDPDLPSATVAAALAPALGGAAVVLCGDWSLDRGSGSVPAFLAAELAAAQALGAVALEPADAGTLAVERRLDGGRRERVRVRPTAVVSVEGAVARLRRAPLPSLLAAHRSRIEVVAGPSDDGRHGAVRTGPFRPRPKVLPGPDPQLPVRDRILALTGSLAERTPPQRLVLDPGPAAEKILEQLSAWGVGKP